MKSLPISLKLLNDLTTGFLISFATVLAVDFRPSGVTVDSALKTLRLSAIFVIGSPSLPITLVFLCSSNRAIGLLEYVHGQMNITGKFADFLYYKRLDKSIKSASSNTLRKLVEKR
ncbi:hypothetical protein ACQKGP_24000 [Lysinibacillus fusiformis]|uniref:hypothetical protein n=1 Tax=Lysinibacillus fusiformis TaxID=28031 RepID=UPI003D066D98